MKRLCLLFLIILFSAGCTAPAAVPTPLSESSARMTSDTPPEQQLTAFPEITSKPSAAPISEPAPTPEQTPTHEPTPTPEPAAMAADGNHPQLVAHGGGAVYGYRLTNSLEALDSSYANGFRFFELDFQRGAGSGDILLLHDWESMARRLLGREGVMSREDFLSSPALADLTLLDLDALLDWLGKHPGCAVITDIKSADNLAMLAEIRQRAGELSACFIPQAYSFEEAESLLADDWDRVILTLYRISVSAADLADYLNSHDLWAVTMSAERINDDLADAVTGSGTALYCHAVNTLDFVDAWRGKGLTGIYTDYFTPDHWVY